MLFRFIAWLFLAGRALNPARIGIQLCRPEHKTVIEPVIEHKQVTGKPLVIKVCFGEVGQFVALGDYLRGKGFFIVILSYILVLKGFYQIVRIFLAQIMAFVVAPHEKGFLLGVAQILHRITQGKEVFRNPAFAD